MDIIQQTSVDVPYDDTNYEAEIVIYNHPPGSGGFGLDDAKHTSIIHCSKVMSKKFKDMTYFKFDVPAGTSITSEESIQINITRDDGHRLTINAKIRNNIVAIETVNIKWIKWVVAASGGGIPSLPEDFLNQMRRLQPSVATNPVWDQRGAISLGQANPLPGTMTFRTLTNNNTIMSGTIGDITTNRIVSYSSDVASIAADLEAMHGVSARDILADLSEEDDIGPGKP